MVEHIINGLLGGLLATIVMTAFMMTLGGDDPPPTALFWSKYIGDEDPEAYMMQGMVLHALYGIGAGGVFAVIVDALSLDISDLVMAILLGLGYAIILFIVAAVFWMNIVLKLDADRRQVMLFLLFHLIYGVVLGAWIGLELISF
ncbi:MAG: hypothetical protein ACOC42_03025 [Halobacteriota archaeon]